MIFGLGGGIDCLRSVEWLQDKHIYYWGDLDNHGFAILARLREFLPKTKSILMDRQTLDSHRDAWGTEPSPKLSGFPWEMLTGDEQEVFQYLQEAIPGQHLRLEQERIRFPWLIESLEKLRDRSISKSL